MEMKLCAPILRMPAWVMRFRISACASFYYRFRLTLATARRLAVQKFGTAKGLEPDYEVDLSNCTLYMKRTSMQIHGMYAVFQTLDCFCWTPAKTPTTATRIRTQAAMIMGGDGCSEMEYGLLDE